MKLPVITHSTSKPSHIRCLMTKENASRMLFYISIFLESEPFLFGEDQDLPGENKAAKG